NDQLILRGERPSPRPPERSDCCLDDPERSRMHMMEIDHGPFHRALEMPERVVSDQIKACYRNGFLWVKMPKGDGAQ
ncbi:MAG: Hsp20/alpha crystallin family protein, partial [Planctomycetota bacterium]